MFGLDPTLPHFIRPDLWEPSSWTSIVKDDPEKLFKYLTGALVVTGVTAKAQLYLKPHTNKGNHSANSKSEKPAEILSLQQRFLPVFFLLRMSFWMAGPYFYQVYSTKMLNRIDGTTSPATSEDVGRVSLIGYLSVVMMAPLAGGQIDRHGHKTATVVTCFMYAVGSLSVFSNSPPVLYLGRAVASIASSRLMVAPEGWLVSKCRSIQEKSHTGRMMGGNCWLSEIFALAYGGDALVAILAGQTASWAASLFGKPTGPFSMSFLFVGLASLLTILLWGEQKVEKDCAKSEGESNGEQSKKKKRI